MALLIEKNFKTLKEGTIHNYSCLRCHNKTELKVIIAGGFISIFLIPMLPLKKECFLTCENCKKRVERKNLNYIEKEQVEKQYNSASYKVPLQHFSGLAFLMMVMVFAIYTGVQVKKEEKGFIQNPKINDVYYVKNKVGWTTYKVLKVTEDSIYVFQNKLTLDNYKEMEEIDKEANYLKVVGYTVEEIKKMFDSDQIYQVNR